MCHSHRLIVSLLVLNLLREDVAVHCGAFVTGIKCNLPKRLRPVQQQQRYSTSPTRGGGQQQRRNGKKANNVSTRSVGKSKGGVKKKEMDQILRRMDLQPASNNRDNQNDNASDESATTTTTTTTTPSDRHKELARPSSASIKPSKMSSPGDRSISSSMPHTFTTTTDNSFSTTITSIDLLTQLRYARNGHAVLRSFLDANLLQKLRTELERFAAQHEIDAWRQKVEVQSGSLKVAQSCATTQDCLKVLQRYLPHDPEQQNLPFLQYFNTWKSLTKVQKYLTHSPRLANAASVLLDCPRVRLYQDSLFCKYADQQPGGGPTPWHVDARMAPFDTSNMITFWIPFQYTTHTGLVFCSKSHADFSLPFWNAFDSPAWHDLEQRYPPDSSIVDYMPLAVGDVTVHSGWTLHCADAANNEEGDCRMALAITYVDARATIRPDAVPQLQAKKPNDNNNQSVGGGGYGDMEDFWSYRDWIGQVPFSQEFQHEMVPIVWPPPHEQNIRNCIDFDKDTF